MKSVEYMPRMGASAGGYKESGRSTPPRTLRLVNLRICTATVQYPPEAQRHGYS